MRYFGGKQRISKNLSKFLNSLLGEGQPFVDAFCGSCNVVSQIDDQRVRIANDIHQDLISMWKMVQLGWLPPREVTEDEYKKIKLSGEPWLRAFVGFGCSYSGKFWGGYARGGETRNYAENAYNSTMKKASNLKDVYFYSGSYKDIEIPEGSLVYCDIPYKGTTGYSTGSFDHESFYMWAKEKAGVVVSEYAKNVPDGATVIWTQKSKKDIRNKFGLQEPTEEVLFTWDSGIITKVRESLNE